MRRRLLLPLIALLNATTPCHVVHAQQIEPGVTNYYLISAVLAGGSVVSFSIYRNIASCTNDPIDNPTPIGNPAPGGTQTETNCQARENLKIAMFALGVGCAAGAIWALVRGIQGDKFKSTGVINLSPGQRGSLRLPDVAYSPPTRSLRVLLVHAAF